MLYLTRVTTAFAAVGNLWFIVLWSRAIPAERAAAPAPLMNAPLWLLLAGSAAAAIGLFAFAMAMNDAIDARRDRALHPERPLPSGAITPDAASVIIALALIGGLLGATVLGIGAVLLVLLTASAILVYNLIGRHIPSVGLVLLSLIYGSHMVAANAELVMVWPVWLVMTHALLLAAATHRLAGKRPILTRRMIAPAVLGWAFWSAVLLYVGHRRVGGWWPEWLNWQAVVAPVCLALLFALFAWRKIAATQDRQRAAEKLQRYGSLWLPMYATGWLFGQGYANEGFILGGLAIAGLAGMTIFREIYALIEHPVGYRRV